MKKFLLAGLLVMSLKGFGQTTPVFADPALGDFDITNLSDNSVDANLLEAGQVYKLKLTIFNLYPAQLPDHSAKIQIGLGSKLVPDPNHSIAASPLGEYFDWATVPGSQVQIIGTLKAALPANFDGTAVFYVKPNVLGTSTVTGQFSVTNNNSSFTLSDINSANNSASLSYTNTPALGPLPVIFTSFMASNASCHINLAWGAESQMALARYEVELSKDGITFSKKGEVKPAGTSVYSFSCGISDEMKAPKIFVRIKSVDLDGTSQYSKTITVSGLCGSAWQLSVYPNPATEVSSVTITAVKGVFNGKYKISIFNVSGQLLLQKEVELINTRTFPLSITGFINGKYHIKVANAKGTETSVLELEKL